MANFNILGQTINSLTGFVLEDTGGTSHTFTEGGGDDFVITLSENGNADYIPDCTFDEAKAAFTAGKTVVFHANRPAYGEYLAHEDMVFYEIEMKYTATEWTALGNISYEWTSSGRTRYDPETRNELAYYTYSATATPADVASGKVFYNADGKQTGTASGGSGSSSWTLVASTSYTVSTTSTTAATVATWSTGASSLWTSDSYVYVRIRDAAGKRAGYFYGSDKFFVNNVPANGTTTTSLNVGTFGQCYKYSTSSTFGMRYIYGTTGYGVYADTINSDGSIRIRSRYNSSYSLTINGTYNVEVYLLTPPSAIFT